MELPESYSASNALSLSTRIRRHQDGSGARHTRQLKEFALVFVEGPREPLIAVRRECQLKKWSRAKKLALIQDPKIFGIGCGFVRLTAIDRDGSGVHPHGRPDPVRTV